MPLKGWYVRIDVMTIVSTMSICRVIGKQLEQLEFQRQRGGEVSYAETWGLGHLQGSLSAPLT